MVFLISQMKEQASLQFLHYIYSWRLKKLILNYESLIWTLFVFFSTSCETTLWGSSTVFCLNDAISSCQKVGEAVSPRFMLQQRFNNISNCENPSKDQTILVLRDTSSLRHIDWTSEFCNSEFWRLHPGWRETKSQIFFLPSKPWHKKTFKCVALCAPFLRDDQTRHCLTGVKLHVTSALPPSLEEEHKGA